MNNCNFKFIQSIYKMLFKGDNINDKISNVMKYNIKMKYGGMKEIIKIKIIIIKLHEDCDENLARIIKMVILKKNYKKIISRVLCFYY